MVEELVSRVVMTFLGHIGALVDEPHRNASGRLVIDWYPMASRGHRSSTVSRYLVFSGHTILFP